MKNKKKPISQQVLSNKMGFLKKVQEPKWPHWQDLSIWMVVGQFVIEKINSNRGIGKIRFFIMHPYFEKDTGYIPIPGRNLSLILSRLVWLDKSWKLSLAMPSSKAVKKYDKVLFWPFWGQGVIWRSFQGRMARRTRRSMQCGSDIFRWQRL